jgi:hypothetical protein
VRPSGSTRVEMKSITRWHARACHVGLLLTALAFALPALADPDKARALLLKHQAMDERLLNNQFNRPVVLDSQETPNRVTGEIHAVVEHPFASVSRGLNSPDHWCDVMSLHINTKYCRAVQAPGGTTLKVNIGKKTPESLQDAPRMVFDYQVTGATPAYLAVQLDAKAGPLGTSDYRIELEAIPLPGAKSFLRLKYSYAMNFAARLAMQTYLSTVGSAKVGFTLLPTAGDAPRQFIAGARALVERNTMRYYLAIDSFLAASSEAPARQLEARLQSWFTAVERYPRQLHELERGDYVAMKRDEYQRQKTAD